MGKKSEKNIEEGGKCAEAAGARKIGLMGWIGLIPLLIGTASQTEGLLTFILIYSVGIFGVKFMEFGREAPRYDTTVYGYDWPLYNDPLPLTIEDLITVNDSNYNKEMKTEESIFLRLKGMKCDTLARKCLPYAAMCGGNNLLSVDSPHSKA